MAAPRLSTFAMSAALAVLLVLCFASSVRSQSYVPQPAPFAGCPAGQQQITVGTMDTKNTTLFPYNDEGSIISGGDLYYQYVYVTPFTLRGQNAFGSVMHQMAVRLGDQRYLLGEPAHLRLGIYLYQEAEKSTNRFDLAALIAQTDEITLYPSADQILYANLQQPVILDSEGDYGMAIYSDHDLVMAAGEWGTGAEGLGQFPDMNFQYNDYSLPEGVELYPGDARRPIIATGCLDSSQFKQPNTDYYAFCALVETYKRQPANNTNPLITSLTNVTRYSGVIGVLNNQSVKTAYGLGRPIVFMEGEIQLSTNAGALVYPPLGLFANPFFYSRQNSLFPNASDLLYPDQIPPIDTSGIVVTTVRNQTNLFANNVSDDQTIGQRGAGGVIDTYFSLFEIFPASDLEKVLTQCNVPPGYDYAPTNFQCDGDAAPVSFGDVDLNDVDPVEDEVYDDFLPPNMISFRFFTAWTPNTTIYQLSYFTYANPVAIVHMRMGLFTTNTSYVDSFSALPQYQLLEETEEIELVNVDDTMIINNLKRPVKLIQNKTYAIGVWSDSLLYGPQARWGVDAAGAPLPYNLIDIDGTFPKQILALGGQTGTQPMAAVGCVAKEHLITFEWCATFADYYEIFGVWYLERRFYSGTFWGLSTPYQNDWGTYHILTAGNGTYWVVVVEVPPPPVASAAWKQGQQLSVDRDASSKRPLRAGRNQTAIWNLNNFQIQSQDYLYTSSRDGSYFDRNGIQIIISDHEENYESLWAVILNSVKPRGSPEYFYQESVEELFEDKYYPLFNSGVEMHAVQSATAAQPTCPLVFVPWDLVYIGLEEYTFPYESVCVGFAQMESTYGDNRIAEYVDDQEGHVLPGSTVYTYNFTAVVGNYLDQVSINVLNNTHLDVWVTAYMGIYAQNGTLLSQAIPVQFLEPLDQEVVTDLVPPFFITEDGLYYVAVRFDHDYFVATGTGTGLSMKYAGEGLPDTFAPDGISRSPPIAAYGCITASHYFCGSFQYYQGDDYSPVAVDYLYQGLLLAGGPNGTSASGFWQSVSMAVGHLTSFVRIARYAANFMTDFTDILLSQPGNATSNYVIVDKSGAVSLDAIGLTFQTSDAFGYTFTINYNSSLGEYVDSSNPQLGPELLNTWVIAPIDFSVGIPQCSFLDLEQYVSPASSLNSSVTQGVSCPASSSPVVWGDYNASDYFYTQEGLFNNYYTNITLSPFSTGPTYSNVTQLALSVGANGNVFAHIRMALYLNNTLLAETNEVTVDNPQDVTLYFTLNETVTLYPASQYYIAMWTDVSLYMAAAWDYSGLCYYGITYGYDLQPWPASIGSVEAKYVNCHAIPVAALGCAVDGGPAYVWPVDPNCPVVNNTNPNTGAGQDDTGATHSTTFLVASVLVAALVAVLLTLLTVWCVVSGKCSRVSGGVASIAQRKKSGGATEVLTNESSSEEYAAM